MEQVAAYIRRRQETINRRFKQWGVLKQVYRGDIPAHGKASRLCAIVTRLAINNGEPLFQVEYEDPDFDNLYFEDDNENEEDSSVAV
jgi:hypothetical protein